MSFEMHSFCSFQLLHFITDKFPLSWSLLHLLLRLVFQLCQIFLSRSCCWNLQLLVGNIDVKNATNSVNMITDGSQCPECVFLEVITFNLFIDWKLSLNCCLSMWQQHDNLNYSPQLCNRWAVWQSVMKEFVNLTWRRIEDPWHTALNELTETCDTLPWMNSLRPVTHCLEWTHWDLWHTALNELTVLLYDIICIIGTDTVGFNECANNGLQLCFLVIQFFNSHFPWIKSKWNK